MPVNETRESPHHVAPLSGNAEHALTGKPSGQAQPPIQPPVTTTASNSAAAPERRNRFVARLIPADDPDRQRALHLAMGVASPAREVADLLKRAKRGDASIDLLFGSFDQRGLASAALAVASPGGAALVCIPSGISESWEVEASVAALRALCAAARSSSLSLLEILVPKEASNATEALRQAGFRRLTNLVYLTRSIGRAVGAQPANDELRWVGYSPDAASLFCAALERSYVQSLDCPELTGLRPTADVLRGHQATGSFDPSNWWVVLSAGEPAGVLCLNGIPQQAAMEIVYVGVAPTFRGRGVGDALLSRALSLAGAAGATLLTLAVDERNVPARRLYNRWGFRSVLVREAWIASPGDTET